MKYFLRALKAFVYFCVFFIILTLVLYYGRVVPAMSYTDMFEEGALWQILAYFVVFAAIYPIFGYNKVEMFIDGGYDGNADPVPVCRIPVVEFCGGLQNPGADLRSDIRLAVERARHLRTRTSRLPGKILHCNFPSHRSILLPERYNATISLLCQVIVHFVSVLFGDPLLPDGDGSCII